MVRTEHVSLPKCVELTTDEMRTIDGGGLMASRTRPAFGRKLVGIAPLPSPHPRPMDGWVGIEPNPTP